MASSCPLCRVSCRDGVIDPMTRASASGRNNNRQSADTHTTKQMHDFGPLRSGAASATNRFHCLFLGGRAHQMAWQQGAACWRQNLAQDSEVRRAPTTGPRRITGWDPSMMRSMSRHFAGCVLVVGVVSCVQCANGNGSVLGKGMLGGTDLNGTTRKLSLLIPIASPHGGCQVAAQPPSIPPRVTFRRVVASLRGPGQSPVLPFACCVGSLLSAGRCGRCSCWCRFRVRGAQWLVCRGCAGCGRVCRLRVPSPPPLRPHAHTRPYCLYHSGPRTGAAARRRGPKCSNAQGHVHTHPARGQ